MKFIRHDDRKIAYTIEGKGVPIVLLHGFCEDHFVWEEFKQELLEANYCTICMDMPGFGESEVIPNLSIETIADIVYELIQALNLSKIILIGHSMGGYTAMAFARKYADALIGLGMFHSHPYADHPAKKENRDRSIEVVKAKGTALFVKQLIPSFFAPKFVKSSSFVVDKFIHRASNYSSQAIIEALQAMRDRPDSAEVLAQLNCPVLFIIGKEDLAIPLDATMEQTHLAQTAMIEILDEVGHMGMIEARKKTQQIVLRFAAFCLHHFKKA